MSSLLEGLVWLLRLSKLFHELMMSFYFRFKKNFVSFRTIQFHHPDASDTGKNQEKFHIIQLHRISFFKIPLLQILTDGVKHIILIVLLRTRRVTFTV